MKKQIIIPVGKRLLIKRHTAETKTAGGIIIPEVAQKKEYKGITLVVEYYLHRGIEKK